MSNKYIYIYNHNLKTVHILPNIILTLSNNQITFKNGVDLKPNNISITSKAILMSIKNLAMLLLSRMIL